MRSSYTVLLSVLFVFLWSSGWVGAKFGLGYSGPFTFLTIRYLLVVLGLSFLVAFLSTCQKFATVSRREFFGHALVGVLSHGVYLAGGIAAMTYGVTAGMVAFVAAMQPLLTTICAIGMSGGQVEKANRFQWMGLSVGVVAVYITLSSQLVVAGTGVAYSLLLVSVIAISIATLIDRRMTLARKNRGLQTIHLNQILWIHSTAALVFFAGLGWTFERFEATWNLEYVLTLIYMAAVVSIASYGLMYLLLRRTTAINVSSLIYLTPPATMLLAWPVLGESITTGGLIGLGFGALAVTIILSSDKIKSRLNNSGSAGALASAGNGVSGRSQRRYMTPDYEL